jgi:hypothetical protein
LREGITFRGDWEMWARLTLLGALATAPEPLFVYWRVAGSLSSNALRFLKARAFMIERRSLFQRQGAKKFLLRRKIHVSNHYEVQLPCEKKARPSTLG